MNFDLLMPQKIIFGQGVSFNIGKIVKEFKGKFLILSGGDSIRKNGNYDRILNSIKNENIDFIEYSGIKGEPTPESIDQITDFVSNKQIDCIISIGGGSVIDTGKAVAALLVNEKGVENYLEGVGKGFVIKNSPLPFIAVPTTAGSGAEATKNAVVCSRERKYKKSFRDNKMLAKVVIADPILTLSLPETETFYGGMDAICQLIESYVTKKQNPYCNALSSYFIPKALKSIKTLIYDPEDINAREIMLQSSFASGIALANSGLGAVHGFASGLGGMFDIPHGLICAILLPYICKKNIEKKPEIYKDLSNIVNKGYNSTGELINDLFKLNKDLGIPENFKDFNISKNLSAEIVERSLGSSMNGNPVDFDLKEWADFIEELL